MSPRALPLALALVVAPLALHAAVARAQVTETSVALTWTATGDDSLVGQAARYDLRWSRSPIVTPSDFAAATPVTGLPVPAPAGAVESATVTGLTPETAYWFALVAFDEAGNASALSNIATATTIASSDVIRPAPVDLAFAGSGPNSVTVSWTDAGDDSLTGTATATEIRWATSPITEADWATAHVVSGVPTPGAPGTPHQLTIGGLDRSRDLWFAARARDDVNRESGILGSLLVQHLLDTAPPATPGGLAGRLESPGAVQLDWSANAEPDLAGYHVYRALSANGTAARLTTSPLSANQYRDSSVPDTAAAWYAVTAVDATGNESARTPFVRVFLTGAGIASWDIATPYPNPSPVGSGVSIPLSIPAAGPGEATVEIQDAAGQHVRTLRVAGVAPGPFVLAWDGRNEAGRATAPGVYRLWLRAGDVRRLVRVLRTP